MKQTKAFAILQALGETLVEQRVAIWESSDYFR